MEKQIQTVYVPTEAIKDFYLDKWVEHEWMPEGYLDKQKAYLYTPKEHAAVQGYRDALEEIDKPMIDEILERNNVYPESQKQTAVRDGKIGTMYDRIRASMLEFAAAQQALSKAEDKVDSPFKSCPKHPDVLISQCGICKGDFPQPTNSLDELEYYQNARETFSNAVSNLDIQTRTACDSFLLAFDHLLNCSKPNNGWISVDDRLPTENGKYLIWENDFDEAHFKNGKWISTQPTNKSTSPYLQSRFRQTLNPTHWQLLPLPPKP